MHGWLPLAIACCTLTVLTVQQIDVGRVESKNGHIGAYWGTRGRSVASCRNSGWSVRTIAHCAGTVSELGADLWMLTKLAALAAVCWTIWATIWATQCLDNLGNKLGNNLGNNSGNNFLLVPHAARAT